MWWDFEITQLFPLKALEMFHTLTVNMKGIVLGNLTFLNWISLSLSDYSITLFFGFTNCFNKINWTFLCSKMFLLELQFKKKIRSPTYSPHFNKFSINLTNTYAFIYHLFFNYLLNQILKINLTQWVCALASL